MSRSTIDRYFELRQQQMRIERELEELKPLVADSLRQRHGVVHLDGYDLMLKTYTAWDYSPRVVEMQQALVNAKRQERGDGTAKVRERRDMLVLRAVRGADGWREIREDHAPYGDEWEADED